MNAIEVDHLMKKFGDLVAVNDISFNVAHGEIFGLLGPERRGQDHADPHDDHAHAAHFGNRAHRRARHSSTMPTACATCSA